MRRLIEVIERRLVERRLLEILERRLVKRRRLDVFERGPNKSELREVLERRAAEPARLHPATRPSGHAGQRERGVL